MGYNVTFQTDHMVEVHFLSICRNLRYHWRKILLLHPSASTRDPAACQRELSPMLETQRTLSEGLVAVEKLIAPCDGIAESTGKIPLN